jgi:hypothetical protein
VGHHVVDLVGLLGALPRADGALEPTAGVGGVDHLEHHQGVLPRRPLGVRAQPGRLSHPRVLDLAAATVVDQHADGVLAVAVGEGHGQRLLAAADVGVVPALIDPGAAERSSPGRVGHVAGADPVCGGPGDGPQRRRSDRGEDPQQGEGFRGRRRLRGGN